MQQGQHSGASRELRPPFTRQRPWHRGTCRGSGRPPHCACPGYFPNASGGPRAAPKPEAGIRELNRSSPEAGQGKSSHQAAKRRELTNCAGEKWNQQSELNLTMALQIGRLTARGGERHTPQHRVRVCGWWAALWLRNKKKKKKTARRADLITQGRHLGFCLGL